MLIFALLVAVPIIEIALFIQVGDAIGLWPTLAIVIATALLGTVMLRSQGIATLTKLQNSMVDGSNPMNPIAHGAMILVSGVLLLTPGFFTDTIGFLLLIPPVRDALVRAGAARMTAHTVFTKPGEDPRRRPDPGPSATGTIDGEFTVLDEDAPTKPGQSGWTEPPR